jgi:glycosyltransferase involved in cell wall biosynthesis
MKIAFFDVYNPIPINSGGDWYRFQLLSDMGRDYEVTEYFTYELEGKTGYLPPAVPFNTQRIPSIIPWHKFSKILDMFKPEYLLSPGFGKEVHADIVFVSTVCYHFAKLISIIRGVPIVLVMHNVEWQYLKGNRSPLYLPMRYYEHYIMKHVNAIIALSPRDYDYVKTNFPEKKLFYIPPTVDTTIFRSDGPKYNFGEDKFNLLFYGSLDREQNIEGLKYIITSLIPALKQSGLMSSVRVNIFGSGIPPKELMLEGNPDINYLGQVENPGAYVRGADLVLVPLRNSGGMKIRLLESIACGKTVVATPEAKAGLPEGLANYVYTAASTAEFIKSIDKVRTEGCGNMVDGDVVQKYLSGDSIADVIDYFRSE